MWRKIWCCWVFVLFISGLQAQPQYVFRIGFTDKAGSPAATLGPRALDRRNLQNIALDDLDKPVSPDYIDSVLTTTGGKFHLSSRWLNYIVVLLTDSSKMLQLQGKPFINSTEYIGYYPTALHKNKPQQEPAEAIGKVKKGTGTQAFYGNTYQQTALVNGDYLHDLGFMGNDIWIAVFDVGFTNLLTGAGFDSMNTGLRLKDYYNFPNAKKEVVQASHGTQALSIMAGYMPGTFVGAAPLASYAAYCTEIGSSEQYLELDNMVAATERADSLGIDIVSVSLGYWDFSGFASPPLTYAQINGDSTVAAKAANIAARKGMLFVSSAGNDGTTSWQRILTPGDADSAITVGVTDMSKDIVPTSGWGPNSSGRMKPDVCMPGPTAYLSDGSVPGSGTATSWSTPQLAGWAACLWGAVGRNVKPYVIRDAIIRSAHKYDSPDNHYGYGVPDFRKALELLGINEIPSHTENWVKLGPNPVESDINLHIKLDKYSEIEVVVVDLSGKSVLTSTVMLHAGNHTVSIPAGNVASGIYILKVAVGGNESIMRMVKR